jgi:hypothetical protein
MQRSDFSDQVDGLQSKPGQLAVSRLRVLRRGREWQHKVTEMEKKKTCLDIVVSELFDSCLQHADLRSDESADVFLPHRHLIVIGFNIFLSRSLGVVEGDIDLSATAWVRQIVFTKLDSEVYGTCTDDFCSHGRLLTTV